MFAGVGLFVALFVVFATSFLLICVLYCSVLFFYIGYTGLFLRGTLAGARLRIVVRSVGRDLDC